MKHIFKFILSAAIAALFALPATGQGSKALTSSGDKALGSYNFEEAKHDYARALERTQDSTERMVLSEKITWCENGLNMLRYASRPTVISSITVPRNRFFLYYSHFPDKSWKKGPDGEAFLYTDDMDKVVIPTRSTWGTYDLSWATRDADGKWGPLTDMGSGVNSADDELYPVMSDDGKKLYFSSKGLYGMGGYDIFVSEWDEARQEWGVAENLGFPYSSPYDDLLFCNTPDGNFSLFASNRACSQDSIVIYLLKYDPTPVKTAVESVEEARRIAALRPRPNLNLNLDIDESLFSHTMYDDDTFRHYFTLVGRYSAVKDSIKVLQSDIAASRTAYAGGDEDDKAALSRAIRETESVIFGLQSQLADLSSEIQAVEMDFLVRGEDINPEEFEQTLLEETLMTSTTPVSAPQYTFIQRTMGLMPDFDFATPEAKVDMNFKVLDESVLITDYTLPDGLVYQIQVASNANRMDVTKLKGLSPAFEKKLGGKYVYRVGLFYTWAEANKALTTVKKKGFSSAAIVAFDDGDNVNVKNAKTLEAKRKDNQKYRLVLREYPDGIPSEILTVIRSGSSADIARGNEEGRVIYFVAPLDKTTAEKLRNAAVAAGAEGIAIEPIK